MRDGWVQVDGIVEWGGEPGDVARHAWTRGRTAMARLRFNGWYVLGMINV